MSEQSHNPSMGNEGMEESVIDLSDAYKSSMLGSKPEGVFVWMDEVQKHRKEPQLLIVLNWSDLPEPADKRQGLMRQLKAFLESSAPRQHRHVTLRGTREEYNHAAKIEANVLSSGVRWEFTDQPTTQE